MNLISTFSIFFCFSFLINSYNSQATSFRTIPFKTPASCDASGEYFDISHLKCNKCPTTNSQPIDCK